MCWCGARKKKKKHKFFKQVSHKPVLPREIAHKKCVFPVFSAKNTYRFCAEKFLKKKKKTPV